MTYLIYRWYMDGNDVVTDTSRLVVVGVGFLTDGGTIRLHLLDGRDQPHIISLQQSAFPRDVGSGRAPGRLYLDDTEVPIRSSQEARLLDLLRTAEVRPEQFRPIAGPYIDELMGFVTSDEYLEFAAQVDATRLGV